MKNSNLYFISIPKKLDKFSKKYNLSKIPIEISGTTIEEAIASLDKNSILSGMILAIAEDPEHKDIPIYKKFIFSEFPDIVSRLTDAAIVKSSNGQFEIAENIFSALSILYPDTETVLLNLAYFYDAYSQSIEKDGLNEILLEELKLKTEEAFEKVAKCKNLSHIGIYNLAFYYTRLNNTEKAIEYFNIYLKSNADEESKESIRKLMISVTKEQEDSKLFHKANELISNDEDDEGIYYISEYLNKNPNVWNAWFLLGLAYRKKGDFENALNSFNKAHNLHKNFSDILNEIAICHMELGNNLDAIEYLDEALNIEPNNIKLLSNKAILELRQNNYNSARILFKKIAEIDKNDPIAQKYLEIL